MAVENELKYALDTAPCLAGTLMARPGIRVASMDQGYLTSNLVAMRYVHDNIARHVLGYKRLLPDNTEIDVEAVVDRDDWEQLWSVATHKVVHAQELWGLQSHGRLGAYGRTRRFVNDDGTTLHVLGYKQPLPDGTSIDVEAPVDSDGWAKLWPMTSDRLGKVRSSFEHDGLEWCVDFFGGVDNPYFVLAEVEMPPGMGAPRSLPTVLEPVLLHAVSRGDMRFSSRALFDRVHAAGLMEMLRAGSLEGNPSGPAAT